MAAKRKLPNGARFYRCALQVNPFAYLRRHKKPVHFDCETGYNAAMVEACRENGIEVVAVADHYRFEPSSKSLVSALREAGIFAFGGFEAVAKDGVHFLCLFDPDKDDFLARYIGSCGVHDCSEDSPVGNLDSLELLEEARKWGAMLIAAHVASAGGLLQKLSGQSRAKVWKSTDLLACALPGPAKDAPDGIRQILQNKDAAHQRPRELAIVNATDVNSPEDLRKPSASCFIKMSEVSVEALRQAFLDAQSRIRLHSDPQPEPHAEFVSMHWEGGFLSGTSVHFNGNLNALVGGRGAGKSTLIESIRYVLGLYPIGEEARKVHEAMVQNVLKPGTKVSLWVRSHHPSEAFYLVERSVPNPPTVKDRQGAILHVQPRDLVPGVQVFGQHEISELARNPAKRTLLLKRFAERDPALEDRKKELQAALAQSRRRIVETRREMDRLEERLAVLPGLEETQKRFREAGLEERLKEKSLLVKEEQLFVLLDERLAPFRSLHQELVASLPLDVAFLADKALDTLPNAELVGALGPVLTSLSEQFAQLGDQLDNALAGTDAAVAEIRKRWDEQCERINDAYDRLLRESQRSSVDGAEFIRIRKRIEKLRPLNERLRHVEIDLETQEAHRYELVLEWEEIKQREFRVIENAAKKVSRELRGKVDVAVTMESNRRPLEDFLRKQVGGYLKHAIDRLNNEPMLSLREFSEHCRKGKESLMKAYGLPAGTAGRLAGAGLDTHMKIDELELPAETEIRLNIASDDETEEWRSLEELSMGQKATAILLLLLLDLQAPLVVDQPEDDLDNRFVTEGIVPIMRREKRRRQFIFSTHNANIPVLGDAELILGLTASGEKATIAREHMGSLDSRPVRELVEETLEGGKDAFEMRRSKYGF